MEFQIRRVKRHYGLCQTFLMYTGFVISSFAVSGISGYKQGEPGIDYPAYSAVPPRLQFSCKGKIPGYYADPETQCQVWHWCLPSGLRFSFICPSGTVFNQKYRVCDWWFNVDCSNSADLYSINEDLYKDFDGNKI